MVDCFDVTSRRRKAQRQEELGQDIQWDFKWQGSGRDVTSRQYRVRGLMRAEMQLRDRNLEGTKKFEDNFSYGGFEYGDHWRSREHNGSGCNTLNSQSNKLR